MKEFKVVILGASGSGKTVFLSSIFKNLGIYDPTIGFFLKINGENARKKLVDTFATIMNSDKDWPPSTDRSEISEWNFSCNAENNGNHFEGCRFKYIDYAGGRLTDQECGELENHVKDADSIVAMFDGYKILKFIRDGEFNDFVTRHLPNIMNMVQNNNKPIQFIISKWDILTNSGYSLETVRDYLMQIREFQLIVNNYKTRNRILRLIPVSSVGFDFVKMDEKDETIYMKKIKGKFPKPFNVEIPLACVLTDAIRQQLQSVEDKEKQIQQEKTNPGFFSYLCSFFNNSLRYLSEILPPKLKFLADILTELSKSLKDMTAEEREKYFQEQKQKKLNNVINEQSALKYLINCFFQIQNRHDKEFPSSLLTGETR